MNIPCCNPPNPCFDPASPVSNYSSEAPDAAQFIGRFFGPPNDPPIGHNWTSTGCIGTCTSTISQADADACAQRQYIECISDDFGTDEPNPDGPPTRTSLVVFQNTAQSADFTCPDGGIFSYTVPAGTYSSIVNQATCDAIALSYAKKKSIGNQICIGSLSPAATCEGQSYSATVTITMPSGNFPIVVSLVAGSMPVEFTLDYDPDVAAFTITGVPFVIGEYNFTIQVEDFDGQFMQKSFTLDVVGITTNSPLPDATDNVNYSQTLTASNTTGTVTWAVTSGSLPPGITLNPSSGLLSGSPTTPGTYIFTVTMTDETP